MKTTYIVTGFMRCGTSMMMQALEAGGLEAAFSKRRDESMNHKWGDEDYKPNPHGFYELGRKEYRQPDFPRRHEGKLIKCLFPGLPKMAPGNYKIVWMWRDSEESRQSFEGFFGSKHPILENPKHFEVLRETLRGIADVRQDMDVIDVWYRDVVENPQKEFQRIKDFGIPIDVDKAVATVCPELYRFRIENLELGI